MSENILERKVIHPGKPFIKQGEEHNRAYVVQHGMIRSYVEEDDQKIEVQKYGPGRIIGEVCLMSDEIMTMNYEALEDTTVITVTRQDFQRKIARIDQNVATILEHITNKLNFQYAEALDEARQRAEMDEDAHKLVSALIAKMPEERKIIYEKAILPHVNALLKEIKMLKAEENGGGEDLDIGMDDTAV